MLFKNLFQKNSPGNHLYRDLSSGRAPQDPEHTALLQVSSAVKAQRDLPVIFEVIGREAGRALKATRSSVFLVDGSKAGYKVQYTFSPNLAEEKPGHLEEKEVARRALSEKKPFLLKEPKDFAEFFKNPERDRKITSLMSVPFDFQGKVAGTLNLSLANGRRSFSQRDFELLAIFANHASIALQNQYLLEEARKVANFRKSYEQHVDDLMAQLQNLSGEERRRIDDHIAKLLSGLKPDRQAPEKPREPNGEGEKGLLRLVGEVSFEEFPNLTEKVQVEIEGNGERGRIDLIQAGIFIPTASPRDLGEEFLLKLYLADGDPLSLPCKVIFSNKYGKESDHLRRGMGIKILDLPPEAEEQIADYLKSGACMRKEKEDESSDPSP